MHRSSRLAEGSGLTLVAVVHHCHPSSDYHRGVHCNQLAGIEPQNPGANSGGYHQASYGKRVRIGQPHGKFHYLMEYLHRVS